MPPYHDVALHFGRLDQILLLHLPPSFSLRPRLRSVSTQLISVFRKAVHFFFFVFFRGSSCLSSSALSAARQPPQPCPRGGEPLREVGGLTTRRSLLTKTSGGQRGFASARRRGRMSADLWLPVRAQQ